MRVSKTAVAASSLVAVAAASENYLGFNSGALKDDNSAKFKADWVQEFTTAQNLVNAPGTFNAVRLYTNIQSYSTDTYIEAFDAAVETKTKVLLGIWTSGTSSIDNELNALQSALDKHGSDLADLIIGISIGSEDLYRNSVTGVTNKSGVGANPDVIVNFINTYKTKFGSSLIKDAPIGHVDTWDAWTNSSNNAVLDAVDWIGVDEYPYYETGKGNAIDNSGTLFDTAYDKTIAAAGGKPVWVTETGWPVTGETWDQAVPSAENAQYYWQEVGCRRLFNKTPTFWYNLRDSNSANEMKFAITNNLSTTPYFDLTCPTTFKTPNSTASASSTGSATVSATATTLATAAATAAATSSSSSSSSNTTTSSSSSTSSTGTSGASVTQGFSAISAVVALMAAVYLL
jgi:glucan endo-1,3-beta-D-glucosidase